MGLSTPGRDASQGRQIRAQLFARQRPAGGVGKERMAWFDSNRFDTVLAVYLGSSLTNLKEVVSNDDFGGDMISVVIFRAIAGETYQIAVDGFLGASGTISLYLSPPGYPQTPWVLHTLDGTPVSS